MSGHTPGPWDHDVVRTSSGICHKIGPFPWKDGKKNHACIYGDYSSPGPLNDELSANARLIAAAPDLLEALERLLADYQQLSDSGDAGFLCIEGHPVGKAAYAAIARAKGDRP